MRLLPLCLFLLAVAITAAGCESAPTAPSLGAAKTPPPATLSPSPLTIQHTCLDSTCTFWSATPGVATWAWADDYGHAGQDSTVAWAYGYLNSPGPAPATTRVTLVVTYAAGGRDSTAIDVHPTNRMPVIDSLRASCVRRTCTFRGYAHDPDGNLLSPRKWTFTGWQGGVPVYGDTVTHSFTAKGTFYGFYQVEDSDHAGTTAVDTVVVK
jgi:hypothetical protein